MHRSGIGASKSVKDNLSSLKADKKTFFIKIEIEKEAFVIKDSGKLSGSEPGPDDFKSLSGKLDDKTAAYVFFRDPSQGNEGKWVLCQHMPDLALVKLKMLYASSRATMKETFGNSSLTEDYFISSKKEFNLKDFESSRAKVAHVELLTSQEADKFEAARDEILAMSEGVALTVADIPIKMSKGIVDAIESFKSSQINTVMMLLEKNTQELLADTKNVKKKKSAMDDICNICKSQKLPRYVLHRYTHVPPTGGGTKDAILFVYYCPDDANPRMKMMYSTCKSMVLRIMEEKKVAITNRYEASTEQELTDATVMYELYPKKTEKVVFAKPKAKKKGKRRLISKKKFNPNAN
mmetsp:Transcript_21664/g.32257  ORF Transcript_21664/g.32257 Transcript_21664/m.32257 type:complete len:350 (-) Transcript_21664:15-1064(-)